MTTTLPFSNTHSDFKLNLVQKHCLFLQNVTWLTFNDNVFGCPLLVEGGEAAVLADADDVLSEVKVLGVKAKQAEPQLPH